MNHFKGVWEHLVGKPSKEALESRIFHAVCIASVVALVFCVFFNYFIGLKQLSMIMVGVSFTVLLFYFYSRHRNKSPEKILFYGLLSNAVFAINFYFNSGIDGPTVIIFVASLFLIITIAPPKQFWFWITLNLSSVLALLGLQYYNFAWVKYTYPDSFSRYSDIFISYSFIVFLIFFITKYIRHQYSIEKKAAEEKTAELEVSNDTKNKLLSILAHDLRSPLDSIQSYLELLSNARLSNEEKQYIEKDLLEKTQNTGQMLSNLLSWTRAQMEGVKANLMSVNLYETLKVTIELQQAAAIGKGISIKNGIDHSTIVNADKDMLQLVIRNLLNNAIKFTPVGGEIHIDDQEKDENVIISVVDNGIGIDNSRQNEIFSLKAKSTYGTHKEKGFGLGLILCKEFTEIQNGTIWFETEASKGTRFFISLKSGKKHHANSNRFSSGIDPQYN